jgi:hypothetical protein
VRGGGTPHRIMLNSRLVSVLRIHRSRIIRKDAGHRREVAHVTVDHAEEGADGFLVGGDAVEVALRFAD